MRLHHSQIYQTRAWEEEKEERWNKSFCDETMKTSEVIKERKLLQERKKKNNFENTFFEFLWVNLFT